MTTRLTPSGTSRSNLIIPSGVTSKYCTGKSSVRYMGCLGNGIGIIIRRCSSLGSGGGPISPFNGFGGIGSSISNGVGVVVLFSGMGKRYDTFTDTRVKVDGIGEPSCCVAFNCKEKKH